MTEQQLGLYPEPGGQEFTDGWTGSDTSHERAVAEQKTGVARRRRDQAIRQLAQATGHGLTWRELGAAMAWHHGQSSGVLSTLHKEGRIARLQDRRARSHIYVLPEYVDGRETREAGRTAANRGSLGMDANELADRLTAAADAGYDKGYAFGQSAGYTEGRDVGWQTGYDQAMAETAGKFTDQQITEAYDNGTVKGRHDEALRMLKLVVTMRDSIKKAQGHRVHNHSGICWMENPACALDSIEKGIVRSLPTRPRQVS